MRLHYYRGLHKSEDPLQGKVTRQGLNIAPVWEIGVARVAIDDA